MALVTFPERKVTRPRCGNRAGCDGSRSYRYTYNAQRQRTRKVIGSEATIYHYDLRGNLIAETRADGTLIRDYVWVDSSPIAQIANGEKLTYLHTDHLQTPRLATNPQGTVVWRWEGTAFGATLPNEDVDNDRKTVTINLRYPGQYYDGETGLHYNWNRYYDPKVGRYVTSDPIGIDGGLNTYAYVANNPLRYTDPFGLAGPQSYDFGICGSTALQRLLLPDFVFGDACRKHDDCYNCSSGRSKKSCDDEFCDNLKKSCQDQGYTTRFGRETCESNARAYCQAVRDYGQGAFDKSRRECCSK